MENRELGIGAPGNVNENHFAAIRKHEGVEAERRARAAAAGLPYVPEHTGTDKFEQLLALVGNPEAARARYEEIVAATDEAKRAVNEAVEARQALDTHKREHQAALDDAHAEHRRAIARREAEHIAGCEQRERELNAREAKLREAEAEHAAAVEAFAGEKAEIERRMHHIRAAAA
jgi:hypothetical protein